MSAAFTAPDFRDRLVESGLRRFFGRGGKPVILLHTDRARPTHGWEGITDPEVQILAERELVRVGPLNDDRRRCVVLTVQGIRAREALRRAR